MSITDKIKTLLWRTFTCHHMWAGPKTLTDYDLRDERKSVVMNCKVCGRNRTFNEGIP